MYYLPRISTLILTSSGFGLFEHKKVSILVDLLNIVSLINSDKNKARISYGLGVPTVNHDAIAIFLQIFVEKLPFASHISVKRSFSIFCFYLIFGYLIQELFFLENLSFDFLCSFDS